MVPLPKTSDVPRGLIEPPPWVEAALGSLAEAPYEDESEHLAVRSLEVGELSLVSVRLRDVRSMPAFAFQRLTADAYERIGRRLRTCRARNPVRLWNYIPGILEPLGDLEHRYMVFNAGRFAAYTRWYRHHDRFDRYVATASGVGQSGDDLMIHCLAARDPGSPVENPRQVAAYRYSARYGPQPPCFARATRYETHDGRLLLVGGTASVRGEDSLYQGDLAGQLAETFRNLAAVVAAGRGADRPAEAGDDELRRYRTLRAYVVRREDQAAVRSEIERAFDLETLEIVPADLCRPELLVEIEGVARLSPASSRPAFTVV